MVRDVCLTVFFCYIGKFLAVFEPHPTGKLRLIMISNTNGSVAYFNMLIFLYRQNEYA